MLDAIFVFLLYVCMLMCYIYVLADVSSTK
jgi:hypothetical protein